MPADAPTQITVSNQNCYMSQFLLPSSSYLFLEVFKSRRLMDQQVPRRKHQERKNAHKEETFFKMGHFFHNQILEPQTLDLLSTHFMHFMHYGCRSHLESRSVYMSKIHVRNDNYMFDFIIMAVLVLFPADNHGSPDPLRDSPERFPLGTSQASPGPISLRICAAFTLPRAKKWREGVGQTALSVPFSNVYLKKRRIWENRFSTGKMGIQFPKSVKRSLELLQS